MANPNPVHKFKVGEINNPAGRPKRKTLLELVEAEAKKLKDKDGNILGEEAIAKTVLTKILIEKSAPVLLEYWRQRDGMPKQSVDNKHSGQIAFTVTDLLKQMHEVDSDGDDTGITAGDTAEPCKLLQGDTREASVEQTNSSSPSVSVS